MMCLVKPNCIGLAAALAVFSSFTFADDASVNVKVSKTKIQIAEPFEVEIVAQATAGVRLGFPSVGQRLGDFDVLDHHDTFDIPADGDSKLRTWIRRLTLETIETGELEIPSIEISVSGLRASATFARSEPVAINVVSILEDRAQPTSFRDIKNVLDVEVTPVGSNHWINWLAAGIPALAAIALAWVVTTRRKRWITPVAWAENELNELRSSSAFVNSKTEDVMSELARILRSYLGSEFEFPASSLPANEIFRELQQQVDTSSFKDPFETIFNRFEQALFAGVALDQLEIDQTVALTETLIGLVQQSHDTTRSTAIAENREAV